MNSLLARCTWLGMALAVAAVLAGAARADGLPIVGVDTTSEGVIAASGDSRYVALPAGRNTLVAHIERGGGRVVRSRLVSGRFSVPAVAYDGSESGLSHDGRTLVLIRPRERFPRRRTTLALLDAERLLVRDVVTLPGDFSFDAVSPDGALVYVIEYVSSGDPTRYRVRAYDVAAGRLLREPVVDPRERAGSMRGLPATRATSPDGRWAYTLYDAAGAHPFIHALDLVRRTARCIDLHALAGRDDLFAFRLDVSGDGRSFTVRDGRKPVAVVDARSFRVTAPPAAVAPRGRESDAPHLPWTIVGSAAVVLVAAGAALSYALRRRTRRRSGVASSAEEFIRGAQPPDRRVEPLPSPTRPTSTGEAAGSAR